QIDLWLLNEIQKICNNETRLEDYKIDTMPDELLQEEKVNGLSDEQICRIMKNGTEDELYEKRKSLGITRIFKMVDTCSAEFEAKTPYFYSTFETPVIGNRSEERSVGK